MSVAFGSEKKRVILTAKLFNVADECDRQMLD